MKTPPVSSVDVQIEKVYFSAKLVPNFEEEYWGWWFDGEVGMNWEDATDTFVESVITKSDNNMLELYQHPNISRDEHYSEADYFEKEDDNHVIPFHLFEVL